MILSGRDNQVAVQIEKADVLNTFLPQFSQDVLRPLRTDKTNLKVLKELAAKTPRVLSVTSKRKT